MRHITKHFHLLKGAKTRCSTILTDPQAMTRRCNRPTGKAGLLPGCRVKDVDLAVAGVHVALSVRATDIIVMVTAGADHEVLSDAVSVFSASVQAVVGVFPMNSSPCALRLLKSRAFS